MTADAAKYWSKRAIHRLACAGFLIICLCAGGVGGAATLAYLREPPWPYDVKERRIMTESVAPGDPLIQRRLIEYHDDCDIRYERRIQSSTVEGRRFIPDDQFFEHPPWDRSGKFQESSILLPENFPCGPAYLVETVTVACNLFERTIRRRRKPDIISPFTVSCPPV